MKNKAQNLNQINEEKIRKGRICDSDITEGSLEKGCFERNIKEKDGCDSTFSESSFAISGISVLADQNGDSTADESFVKKMKIEETIKKQDWSVTSSPRQLTISDVGDVLGKKEKSTERKENTISHGAVEKETSGDKSITDNDKLKEKDANKEMSLEKSFDCLEKEGGAEKEMDHNNTNDNLEKGTDAEKENSDENDNTSVEMYCYETMEEISPPLKKSKSFEEISQNNIQVYDKSLADDSVVIARVSDEDILLLPTRDGEDPETEKNVSKIAEGKKKDVLEIDKENIFDFEKQKTVSTPMMEEETEADKKVERSNESGMETGLIAEDVIGDMDKKDSDSTTKGRVMKDGEKNKSKKRNYSEVEKLLGIKLKEGAIEIEIEPESKRTRRTSSGCKAKDLLVTPKRKLRNNPPRALYFQSPSSDKKKVVENENKEDKPKKTLLNAENSPKMSKPPEKKGTSKTVEMAQIISGTKTGRKLATELERLRQKHETPKEQPVVDSPGDKEDSNLTPDFEQEPNLGKIIWAKFGGKKWWPGIIVKGSMCGVNPAKLGASWVFWYGDHKISEIAHEKIIPFISAFKEKSKASGGKLLRKAVLQAVMHCAQRCKKEMADFEGSEIMEWANDGFRMDGEFDQDPDAANPISEDVMGHLKRIQRMMKELKENQEEGEAEDKPFRIDVRQDEGGLKLVKENKLKIEDVCIACDTAGSIETEHPFFKGGLCTDCKEEIMETVFAIGDDGSNVFCIICGNGGVLFVCDDPNCYRVYCTGCIDTLVGSDAIDVVRNSNPWKCYICTEYSVKTHGLLEGKKEWQQNILQLFQPKGILQPPIPPEFSRKPLRVLALFDGIGTGRLVLDQLGIDTEVYYASEVDRDAIMVTQVRHADKIKQIGDVTSLNDAEIVKLCPIDLVIGGSPCNELSLVNPARKGLEGGTGTLFFEFYRVLQTLEKNQSNHLFWLFENVVCMPVEVKTTISRFLGCEPALWDAKYFSAQQRARYFWGNLPGMYCPLQYSEVYQTNMNLEKILMPGRKAKVNKVRTVTTRTNSLLQGKKDNIYPVQMGEEGDTLWIPELERVFGFPEHYTDVANIPPTRRQKLVGKAWSVPVLKHLLGPLKQFFAAKSSQDMEEDNQ